MRLFLIAAAVLVGNPSAACSVSVSTIEFGIYRSKVDSTSTGSITVDCSIGVAYEVQLLDGDGVYTSRHLKGDNGGELLYNLYTAPDYFQVWGDGIDGGSAKVTGIGTGHRQVLTVYGLIPSGQQPAVGTYSDSVVIIVHF